MSQHVASWSYYTEPEGIDLMYEASWWFDALSKGRIGKIEIGAGQVEQYESSR